MNSTVWDSFPLIKTLSSLNLTTVPLNCYVLWLMRTQTKRTTSDIFALNLVLSEISFSLSIIWSFIYFHTFNFQYFYPYLFSLGFLFTGRPLFQTCICVDYYIGVVHPVYYLKYKPLRYRMGFCCVAWLSVFASCIYCLFFFTTSIHHYTFFVQNLLFMATVVFCCLSVLKALKNPGPGEKMAQKSKSNKSKQKAFKNIFLILISLIVYFSFSVASIPMQSFLGTLKYIEVITICIALSIGSGLMQPLLYLHRVDKLPCFRKP